MNGCDLSRAVWRKSSYSGQNGSCVEVAWIGGGPVEAAGAGAEAGPAVAVRDSKDPAAAVLAFSAADWRAFAARIKSGQLDLS
ncbi:MAG TPA: DUF397 domain-containing protein [Streptosporangiaceae bacterium]|jgi:hypothetical protein